jgi:F420-0:gamma-glutamyl ligase
LMTKVVVGVVIFDSVGKVVRNGSLNRMNHFKLLGLSS